jgi:hypothetical protein
MAAEPVKVTPSQMLQAGAKVSAAAEQLAVPNPGAVPVAVLGSALDGAWSTLSAGMGTRVAQMGSQSAGKGPAMQSATASGVAQTQRTDEESASRYQALGNGQEQQQGGGPRGGSGVQPADYRTGGGPGSAGQPSAPAPPPPPVPGGQPPDPRNPFIGDNRFGHWEDVVPPPYTGKTPPPMQPSHRSWGDVPGNQRTGGPTGFFTPGKSWVDDNAAPWAQLQEEDKLRISGEDVTNYTRMVQTQSGWQQQRWVQYTYESQKFTGVALGGDVWAKEGPDIGAGKLGGVTTGGIEALSPPPYMGPWQPITPQQIAGLSAANPNVTFYVPDGCAGQFTFQGGVPVGGFSGLPPSPPIMVAEP